MISSYSFLYRVYRFLSIKLRQIFWFIFLKNKKYIKLFVYKEHSFLFSNYGDIVRVLFERSNLGERSFEYNTLVEFQKYIRKGDVVLDVGANVGMHSMLSSNLVGSQGKVLSIEASPITYAFLAENIHLNNIKNIKTFNVAVADKESLVKMTFPTEASFATVGDAFKHISFHTNLVETDEDVVKCLTIDSILAANNINTINFMKIDIEGAELLCLRGAQRLLSSPNKPIILLEVHESYCNRFGYSERDVFDYLESFGYKLESYEPDQWIAK